MELKIALCASQPDFDAVAGMLANGWQIESSLKNGITALDNAVVYHLVKFAKEEQELMADQEASIEASKRIISVKDVPLAEVDKWIEQGYTVNPEKLYAKNAVLVKYADAEDATTGAVQ